MLSSTVASLPVSVAGMGSIRDSVTTLVGGRFRLSDHPVLMTVAHAAWISFLIAGLVISLSVTHAERRISEQLEVLSTIFGSTRIPNSCDGRRFPFFFVAAANAVDVSDRNVDDWEKLRDAALKSGSIERSPTDPNLHFGKLACGTAVTPLEANHIVKVQKRDEQDFQFPGFDFSLWFARDDDKDAVYVRGQIESPGREAWPDRLRLNLEYGDRTTQTFVIRRDDEGDLTWVPQNLFFSKLPNDSDARNPVGRHGMEFAGTWWNDADLLPGRARQHFEIRLENTDSITAFKLSAERLSDKGRTDWRVSTPAPVPLYEDIRSYQVTRFLPGNVEFELFWFNKGSSFAMMQSAISGGEPREQGTQEDARSTSHQATGILNAIHRAFLVTQGYEPCPARILRETAGIDKCFRFSGTSPGFFGNRIRMSRVLPASSPRLEDRIVMVEAIPVVGYRDIVLASAAVGCIVLLIWMFANASKQRREALEEENRARATLEEQNASLEKMNLALENYDRVFLHQAEGDMLELKREIANVSSDGAFHGSAKERTIDDLIKKVMGRLDRSTEIFRYPAMIRDLISKFGHNHVSIRETIEILLAERKRDVLFEPILGTDDNPWIPGTCPSDSSVDEPDSYIVEAIETVLSNAYEYRTSGTPIIVFLKMDRGDAIVQVSNHGPTVLDDKLKSVFEFGSRFAGAGQLPPERADSGDGADSDDEADWVDISRRRHLGLGLFITKQIVDGYRGHCFMENRPDGSGVIVTLRLPCARGEGLPVSG